LNNKIYIENKVTVSFPENHVSQILLRMSFDALSIRICVSCKGYVLVLYCKSVDRFIINFIMNVRMRVLFGREEMMSFFL